MSGKQSQIEDLKTAPLVAGGAEDKTGNTSTEENPTTQDVQEDPSWLQGLLDSNAAVVKSNDLVIASNEALITSNDVLTEVINSFKESANDLVSDIVSSVKVIKEQEVNISAAAPEFKIQLPVFNPDANYEVIVPFRDSKNFSKMHQEGDDVTHLGEERIKHLLTTGNVEEV